MPPKKRVIRTSSTESEHIEIWDFHNSASSFAALEEKALRIKIQSFQNSEEVFNPSFLSGVAELSEELKELLLPNFGKNEILTYNYMEHQSLNKNQRKFLWKLSNVFSNSESDIAEKHVDELMALVCDIAGLDDGINLTMQPCNLKLTIESNSFAAHADREGRRGAEITWVLVEDKSRKSATYKKGDLQLAASIIAAFQENRNITDRIYPPMIIGIKVLVDQIFFYSCEISSSYLDNLYGGLPDEDIVIKKYPSSVGLSLANPEQRKAILTYFSRMKNYALSLEQIAFL